MSTQKEHSVCPVEKAGGLDHSFRKLLQNPSKILKPYIKEDMTILDFGCGPGFFSIEMAKMLTNGKVIAADLQEGMLNIVKKKTQGTSLANKIQLHKTKSDSINLDTKVDFILAFYVVHEVPDPKLLFQEFKDLLKPDAQVLIIEPKFHVKKDDFADMIEILQDLDYKILDKPKVFFSRSILLQNN
jgi:ubiquinone/menaquinone biosynthesis C-methylase UbiE